MFKRRKRISISWLEKNEKILEEKIPQNLQDNIFYPEADFYLAYRFKRSGSETVSGEDYLKSLHYMAFQLFKWLNIAPNGCTVDFYEEKIFANLSADIAGFYKKVGDDSGEDKEVIMINSKYRGDLFSTGAILAHEMMHLYLFRAGIQLENRNENELLTDLATIKTGLSLLIINAMFPLSSFGYFSPEQYSHEMIYWLEKRGLEIDNILGYINPHSRNFITSNPMPEDSKKSELIKSLDLHEENEKEKDLRRNNSEVIGSIIILLLIGAVLFIQYWLSRL